MDSTPKRKTGFTSSKKKKSEESELIETNNLVINKENEDGEKDELIFYLYNSFCKCNVSSFELFILTTNFQGNRDLFTL